MSDTDLRDRTDTSDRPDAGVILAPLRQRLDMIDREILELLARRMATCLEVARRKAEHGIPMMQASRVSQVVGRAREYAATHGLSPDYLDDIYQRIIAETCSRETALIAELSGERTQ